MIDFRYHLVSLISVFLALAVGIVLGAGPLQESLGTQLAGQVEQLRTEKDTLRSQNEDLATRNDQLGTYISQTAPSLVAGTLGQRSVALITDDSSTRQSADEVASLVTDAGGRVPVRAALGADLWDPAKADARTKAVAALRGAAPSLSLSGSDDTQRLAAAVPALLVADTDTLPAAQKTAGLQALVSAQMLTLDGDAASTVDAVIYASAAPDALVRKGDDTATAAARAQALNTAQTSVLEVLAARRIPAVIAGSTPGSDDTTGVVRIARGDSRFDGLSTADGLQRPDGPPVAVLALGEQLRGGSGDYGTGAGARARVPASTSQPAGASDGGGAG